MPKAQTQKQCVAPKFICNFLPTRRMFVRFDSRAAVGQGMRELWEWSPHTGYLRLWSLNARLQQMGWSKNEPPKRTMRRCASHAL